MKMREERAVGRARAESGKATASPEAPAPPSPPAAGSAPFGRRASRCQKPSPQLIPASMDCAPMQSEQPKAVDPLITYPGVRSIRRPLSRPKVVQRLGGLRDCSGGACFLICFRNSKIAASNVPPLAPWALARLSSSGTGGGCGPNFQVQDSGPTTASAKLAAFNNVLP